MALQSLLTREVERAGRHHLATQRNQARMRGTGAAGPKLGLAEVQQKRRIRRDALVG